MAEREAGEYSRFLTTSYGRRALRLLYDIFFNFNIFLEARFLDVCFLTRGSIP